jgi:hypothetical protein
MNTDLSLRYRDSDKAKRATLLGWSVEVVIVLFEELNWLWER